MAYDRDLEFVYRSPTKLIFRENAVKDAGIEVEELGCSRALIVTDKGIVDAGLVEPVEKALGKRHAGTYDKCIQDSGYDVVNKATEFARDKGADALISVGGGSVIDTAKGMAILLKEGGKLEDYEGVQMLSRPQTPHVVIPTTAGTGSEVTPSAVIKNRDRNIKMLIHDSHIMPNTAILDPVMTQGLPPMLTATTGMDVMTHAIEAIHAIIAEPIADYVAFGAIRLVVEYLPRCVENGDDLFARGQQQIAATAGGMAFANSQINIVHSLAHSAGGIFGVPHGLANSILLPHVILFILSDCADRYVLVGEALGVYEKGMTGMEAGEAAANAIWEFTKKLGIPQRLRDAGVPEDGLESIADNALNDGVLPFSPKLIVDPEEVLQVYQNAW
ncbi:MAG: hypothetical protein A2W01_12150 [Candidatus Solincola sediminis]|nr:MAG: hypothetical protein A2W01_12150 [Candidatus Solincola sediminis]